MKKVLLFVFAALVLISNTSFSQKNKFALKNQWELGGTVSFTSVSRAESSGSSTTTFKFSPSVGYFVTNGFELGMLVDYTNYSFGGYSYSDYTFYFAPSYNFDTKSLAYPYVQGQIGYTGNTGDYDSDLSGLAWGLEGGVKINVVGNGLFKVGINYNQRTLKRSDYDTNYGLNTVSVVLGVGIFL